MTILNIRASRPEAPLYQAAPNRANAASGRSITESIREANPGVNYLEATATGILHKVSNPCAYSFR